jgi:hypothetical protein
VVGDGAATVHHAEQVDGEQVFPVVGLGVGEERRRAADAGRVHEDVELAERGDGLCDGGAALVHVPDVEAYRFHLRAGGGELLPRCFERVVAKIGDHHPDAFSGHRARRFLAEPRGSSRDQCRLAGQSEVHSSSSRSCNEEGRSLS